MKSVTIAVIALATVSGCAQLSASSASAEEQCGWLARGDGMRVNETLGIETAGDSQNVRMRLEDTFNRRFTATCAYNTASGARWLTPLPKAR
ncbi:MAG: hypothetical protein ACRECQ_03585 [Burkholderiaceae bacterium]